MEEESAGHLLLSHLPHKGTMLHILAPTMKVFLHAGMVLATLAHN